MTGEAKQRGSKEDRIEQAEESQEARDKAAKDRKHTDGLVWLIFECTNSVPVLDRSLAFVLDDGGKIVYGPDNGNWLPLISEDIPGWLQEPGVINELRGGAELNVRPAEGGRWYRAIVQTPNVPHETSETRH
jgi:hypothetical protein